METSYPTKKLGEIIELKYGKGIARADRDPDGKYPVYGANGVLGHVDKYLVEGEAIIIGRKGSAGEVTRVSGKFWPSDVTYYVLGNDQIDINYALHLFRSLNLQRFAVGVKPGINRNRVYEIEIPLPPLEVQKKIVAKLEKLLAKVNEAKKLRAEARESADNLLSAELHKIFEEGKKKGWEEKELGDLFDITSSKRVFKSEWTDSGVPFYRARELVSLAKNKPFKRPIYISEKLYETYKAKYGAPKEGDILVTGVGTLGISYLVKKDDKFYFKDGNIIWLKKKSNVDSRLVEYFFKSPVLKEQIEETAAGATVRTFTIQTAKKVKISLPSSAEQKKIVARLDSISQKIEAAKELQDTSKNEFDTLNQSVLESVFSGRLL